MLYYNHSKEENKKRKKDKTMSNSAIVYNAYENANLNLDYIKEELRKAKWSGNREQARQLRNHIKNLKKLIKALGARYRELTGQTPILYC